MKTVDINTLDSLDIKALSITTRIGVYPWEQRIAQRLLLDICISTDCGACDDDLDKAIDYDKLCQQVTHYVESNTFKLIETVANNVAELIKNEFNVSQVYVSVSKPYAVRNAGDVRVTAKRNNSK